MEKGKEYTHPSFGSIQVSRMQGGNGTNLYGSSIKHRNTIRLTLSESKMERMLSKDWFYTGRTIAEVEMSTTQWAELVASAGIGGGVPCTIRFNNGYVESCPYISKRQAFDNEFEETVQSATESMQEAIDQAKELLNKKTLTKADRQQLINYLEKASMDMRKNLPFVKKQFTEQMDKTVLEAKGEIESWVLTGVKEQNAIDLEDSEELILGNGE